MNIFYRGYLIHEEIKQICYAIYGTNPERNEMHNCIGFTEAMRWIDEQINLNKFKRLLLDTYPPAKKLQPALF
jgi:tRNA A37 N6-isopentenylltransferase MiaA